MISFITWRLNFYRFSWWRRLARIPESRPLTPLEISALKIMLAEITVFGDNMKRDYSDEWTGGAKINARRPTPFKAAQKDKYL